VHQTDPASNALKHLAAYLAQRREAILTNWRSAVDSDPALSTASTITRAQFVDHIPAVLDAFEHRLSARSDSERTQAREEQQEASAEHGLHRWQQGYNQPETMQEWSHLHLCLLREVETYLEQFPEVESSAMQTARRELARLCGDGMCASATRYVHLQQREAATRVRELELALAQLQSLEQERAQAWREAAHDLRGRTHAITSASAVLVREGVPEQYRVRSSEMLRAGVQSLNKLLGDLMDQARLEAGHERRQIARFDVAELLKEFADTTRPVAADKGLFLVAKGESPLVVEGDSAKVQRILQNLVLNALKATEQGGVKITWESGGNERRPQWALCVQDTGPGFKHSTATPMARVLKRATDDAHEVQQQNVHADDDESDPQATSAPTLRSQTHSSSTQLSAGEGIGLSIVKRLCEMLDASIELESSEGGGTTFRIIFPQRYPESGASSGA
jgi:signal transduction histidine kinase